MHVAQQVYRKNRYAMKQGDACGAFQVESVETIREQIQDSEESRHTSGLFYKAPWAAWDMNCTDWLGGIDDAVLEWVAKGRLVELEFTYTGEDGVSRKETYQPETPKSHEREWEKLEELVAFLQLRDQEGKAYANTSWNAIDVRVKANASIDTAKEWMYPYSEMKLRHHN